MSVHIDFETFSRINLKKSNAFRYGEDPSTEALILAYAIGGSDPVVVDLTRASAIEELFPLFEAVDQGAMICAHNVQFERIIWTHGCNFPVTPKDTQWDCTAVRARLIALPGSLEGAAKALSLGIEKDKRGQALIDLFSKPQKNGERVLPSDRPDDFKAFMEYCAQDVIVERRLDQILPSMPEVERTALNVDYKINARGIPADLEAVKKADRFAERFTKTLVQECVDICGYKPTQVQKLKSYIADQGYELPNLQAGTVQALSASGDLPDNVARILEIRIEASRAGVKKLRAIQEHVSEDNRLRGQFMFSAATTRRWGARGVQLHNLQKPEGESNPDVFFQVLENDPEDLPHVFENPLTVISQCVRGFLKADDHFLVSDFSSVESRGVFWLSGEEWLLEAYRQGADVYRQVAGSVYGIKPKDIAKESKERFVGKQLVLGSVYGMGPNRFMETVQKFGQGMTEWDAKDAIYGFRNSVPQLVSFWRGIEQACIKATRTGKVQKLRELKFRPATLSNGFELLYVDMPSGSIAYPLPKVGQELWNGAPRDTFEFHYPRGAGFVKTDTFGGSLTENVTQALTRDILRDAMVASHEAGFNIVGHVHDELICEGRDSESDLRELEHTMGSATPWARGFPIDAEGYISKRYKK